jgi:hypothetical protein
MRLVIGNGVAKAIDDGLASLIARAIATRTMLLTGRDNSIDAMASRLGVRRDYLAVLMRLSYLSPEIVRAILTGEQPIELTPTRLVMLSRNLPHDCRSSGGSSDLRLPDAAQIPPQCLTCDESKTDPKDTSRLRAPQAAVLYVSGTGPL